MSRETVCLTMKYTALYPYDNRCGMGRFLISGCRISFLLYGLTKMRWEIEVALSRAGCSKLG